MSGFISVPQFPAVGNFPGVPAIARLATAQLPLPVAALADAVGILSLLPPSWGIISQSGGDSITGDSVIAVALAKDFMVSDYPIEQGSFASYNKVAQPFDVRVTFSNAGGANQFLAVADGTGVRAQFFATLDAAIAGTDLFSVLTPEVTYPNVNVVHYDFRREAKRGTTLIQVDVWCKEIRIAPAEQSSVDNTQSPNGADPQNGGWVSAAPVPVSSQQLPPAT